MTKLMPLIERVAEQEAYTKRLRRAMIDALERVPACDKPCHCPVCWARMLVEAEPPKDNAIDLVREYEAEYKQHVRDLDLLLGGHGRVQANHYPFGKRDTHTG